MGVSFWGTSVLLSAEKEAEELEQLEANFPNPHKRARQGRVLEEDDWLVRPLDQITKRVAGWMANKLHKHYTNTMPERIVLVRICKTHGYAHTSDK
jgi:hypothetical protein